MPSDDVATVLAASTGRMAVWLTLMAYNGLRCCEVAAFEWEWIDWSSGTLWIVGKGGHVEPVPAHPRVLEVMSDQRCRSSSGGMGRVWPAATAGGVSAAVRRFLRGVLGRGATAHELRHSFGTVAASGGDLLSTRAALRHASIGTTLGYAAAADGRVRAAVGSVGYGAAA